MDDLRFPPSPEKFSKRNHKQGLIPGMLVFSNCVFISLGSMLLLCIYNFIVSIFCQSEVHLYVLRVAFQTPDGIVKKEHWEAILRVEGFTKPNLRIAYKLTPSHLNPTGYKKMNVPLAFQVCYKFIMFHYFVQICGPKIIKTIISFCS